MAECIRLWGTPVYQPTGQHVSHYVVTVPVRRFGFLRCESKELADVNDARAFAQSEAERLGLQVVEEGVL